jgi:FtsP/CotA-like multicopper oxidase with cupredoxin domain
MKKILVIIFVFFITAESYSQIIINLRAGTNGSKVMSDGANLTFWGFSFGSTPPANPQLPAPVLYLVQGNQYRIVLRNFSPHDHTIHLHGLDVDQQNDGFPMTSFVVPAGGGTGQYNFIAPHAGTYYYHCHVESFIHLHLGMYGAIIIRPPDSSNTAWQGGPSFDIERMWTVGEMDSLWFRNQLNSNFNIYNPKYFVINGKEQADILNDNTVKFSFGTDQTVLLRLLNSGYMIHNYKFNGLNAVAIASDGRPLPASENIDSIYVLPGERYDVLITSNLQGDYNITLQFLRLYREQMKGTVNVPVTVTGPSLIKNETEIPNEFRLYQNYPNPFNPITNIKFSIPVSQHTILKIFDITGREVAELVNKKLEAGEYNFELQITNYGLSSGVYFYTLRTRQAGSMTENFVMTKKMLIVK